MMNKFSNDPKVLLVSLKEFVSDNYKCLGEVTKKYYWKDKKAPEGGKTYYKLTSNYLIKICYGYTTIGFEADYKELLEYIEVAYRDGKTEYLVFDELTNSLKEKKEKNKNFNKYDEYLSLLFRARKRLPKFLEKSNPVPKPFETYLIDTGYKTTNSDLKDKYLVFDVETNGLRKKNDDLLSLSIYDPSTGICYNRFFPLDLQPMVLTGYINGITEEVLNDSVHMTQEEMDWLVKKFKLKDRILLSYSGGKGLFDSSFVQNYCKRHKIVGFDGLKFENIKNKLPRTPFGFEGELTKDNLCKMFKIEGVDNIHSSYNDCLLEWKLYEKLYSECIFIIGGGIYKMRPGYIVPYSYLYRHPELKEFLKIEIPSVKGKVTEIFKLEFPQNIIKKIKKYTTNITGITIENGINAYLNAKRQDNFQFLTQNKAHLEYVGSLISHIHEIPVIKETDGTIKAIYEEDEAFIEEVNKVTKIIIEQIKPVADFIKENIFKGEIMTQELSITKDKKVMALCDLSDKNSIIEIKASKVLDENGDINEWISKQLYYQSNGRNIYVLSILFDTHISEKIYREVVDDLNIYLYKVDLYEYDPSKIVRIRCLTDIERSVLKELAKNPKISKQDLSFKLCCSSKHLNKCLDELEKYEYIRKEKPNSLRSPWILLRKENDIHTKYTMKNDIINIIKE